MSLSPFFFFNDTATTEIYTLSLHDALPISFVEEVSARREAERGTFDPTYLVYSVGKLMLLKLRQDVKAQQGKSFSLRSFHDTLLAQGTAPFWLHRQLMLGEEGDVLD